jgi:hypothetical protein
METDAHQGTGYAALRLSRMRGSRPNTRHSMGTLLFFLVEWIERLVLPWHVSLRAGHADH